jgi:NAD(P)-dependent dehydrogenase (short-subunit alcohol dehydrogenase family)
MSEIDFEMLERMFGLRGKIAIVTGGTGLLGREFVKTLHGAGARVAVFDLQTDVPEEYRELFKSEGVAVYRVDVTDRASIERALDEVVRKWGPPSILVNAAAIDVPPTYGGKVLTFENYPEDLLRKILDVNVIGTILCTQVIGEKMAESGGGSIINISSIYGEVSPDQRVYLKREGEGTFIKPASYCISKGAISNLTKYLATYWAEKNIRVNCLIFGGVFNQQDPEFVRNYSSRVPLGRMARKDEYNGAVLFLASDASSYMTGANIVIDGGYTAW